MEVGGSRFASMEISMEVGRSTPTSMEVSRSFHRSTGKFHLSVEVEASNCFHQLQLPRIYSVEASMSLHTPTYFHLLPRVSQTSSCFHKTDPKPKLELPPWKLAHFQLDGSTRKSFVASMEAGTTYIEAGFLLTSMLEASASMEVDGSRWKLSWK